MADTRLDPLDPRVLAGKARAWARDIREAVGAVGGDAVAVRARLLEDLADAVLRTGPAHCGICGLRWASFDGARRCCQGKSDAAPPPSEWDGPRYLPSAASYDGEYYRDRLRRAAAFLRRVDDGLTEQYEMHASDCEAAALLLPPPSEREPDGYVPQVRLRGDQPWQPLWSMTSRKQRNAVTMVEALGIYPPGDRRVLPVYIGAPPAAVATKEDEHG